MTPAIRLLCVANAFFVVFLALLPVTPWVAVGCGALGWLVAASFA